MVEGKDTHNAEQEKEPSTRQPWWKRLWGWTKFGEKSGWDWLQLLVVPLALAFVGLWFTMQQDARQQRIEERRAQADRELEQQRAQDVALQSYLDQMNSLLLEKDLRSSETGSEVRTLARACTLTVLGRLDPSRKTQVIGFLQEANLVQRVDERDPIIALSGANLSDANLRTANLQGAELTGADLSGASLSRADLSSAELIGADLSGADLSDAFLHGADLDLANLNGANLSGADLEGADLSKAKGVTNEQLEQQAENIEGATMPD
jgi:uncharacterized protein YjbI with pentapeptide repeats